ncbi:hypothetical protein [Streptomyces sp. NBC_00872]|uniref:hypothetical protein n=1 Tax=Streptomyces sp. NBC_00872 TaxID=2903686 RepID=UPI003867C261|nr:hypothetical protein OG214_23595 [Streptomyces sp. NBC_00872]
MSVVPTPEPQAAEQSSPPRPPGPPRPHPALIFDDPLDQQSSDDTDGGWGERPTGSGDSAADLARFLDEKPPHHL